MQVQMEKVGRFLEWRGAPALAYTVLAFWISWPLALNPSGSYVGGARTDALNAIWSLWFAHDALAEDRLPLQTHLLNHPIGGRLVVADLLNAFLGFPLVAAFGAVAAYAILVHFHLWFSGMAAHALGRKLGGSGWISGVGYVASPLVLSHLQNGSSEAVAAGWLPLGLLGLIHAIEGGGVRRVLLGGGGLFLAALGSGWYAGVGAFLCAGMIGVLGWPKLGYVQLWKRLVPAVLLGLALTAPLAVGVKSVAVAPDGLVEIKNPLDVERIRRTLGPADPRVFFAPAPFASPDFQRLEGNPSDRFHTVYLGYVLLALAMVGLWRHGMTHPALWATLGLGLVLAMGPVVVVGGFPLSIGGKALPLPYALVEALPGFSALSLLYRLASVSVLLLAVLADRSGGRWAILILLEVFIVSPAKHLPEVTTLPELPAAQTLGSLPPGAVLNLPIVPGRNFLYEQILHHKPVVGSLNTSVNLPGLQVLSAARKLRAKTIDKEAFSAAAQQAGVRYVVTHKNVMSPEAFVSASTAISQSFAPVAQDDRMVVYQLW